MQRILCLYMPWWDVQLMWRRQGPPAYPGRGRPPAALFVAEGKTERICRACPQARHMGIAPGMPLAEAQAMCSRLFATPLQPLVSGAFLERLAHWCRRFTPRVGLDFFNCYIHPPSTGDTLFLDITGAAHVFGGEDRLLAIVIKSLAARELTARAAIAPAIGSAWALAHYGPHDRHTLGLNNVPEAADVIPAGAAHAAVPAALTSLPTAALRLSIPVLEALREVGVDCIGHLLPIGREQLHRRFGPEIGLRLDQALGVVPETFAALPEVFSLEITRVLEGPILNWEFLWPRFTAMLEELAGRLEAWESGVRVLQLTLQCDHAPAVQCAISILKPTRQVRRLALLLKTRLETLRTPAAVTAITLTAAQTARLRHAQDGIWEAGQANLDQGMAETADLLSSRLGPARVRRMQPVASHVPERAARPVAVLERQTTPQGGQPREKLPGKSGGKKPGKTLVKIRAKSVGKSAEITEPPHHALRPSFLLAAAEPITAVALQAEPTPGNALANAPARVEWRGLWHELSHALGPERITTEWWQPGAAATRDYFFVQNQRGQWLWIFRQQETGQWFIQGVWS